MRGFAEGEYVIEVYEVRIVGWNLGKFGRIGNI